MKTSCNTRFGALVLIAGLLLAPVEARAVFEDVEVSPRARALGSAFAALPGDVYAALHNPASLAWCKGYAAAASYVRPFGYDFVSQGAIVGSVALPDRWGGVGIGLQRFGVDYMGESLTNETTVAVAHGFKLMNDWQSSLSVGWGLRLHALDYGRSVTGIDPGSARAVGISVGAQAIVRQRTQVGFHALNINNPSIGKLDKEELRRKVVIGVTYTPYPGVRTALDVSNELGELAQIRGGAEFEITSNVWLRAGLHTEPSQFTAGFGARAAGVMLDYGFTTGGVLSDTHHFGLGIAFPRAE